MSRRKCCRLISCTPDTTYYKPKGIPASDLEEIVVTLDEFEAIKLADFQQLYQEQAAKAMRISRQTFGRVIESAHFKIAQALLQGHAIRIEGGEIAVRKSKPAKCKECNCIVESTVGEQSKIECPRCKRKIKHVNEQKGKQS